MAEKTPQRMNFRRGWRWLAFILWLLIVLAVFDRYAYTINEFNTKTRVYLRTGETSGRVFDENGIPLSHSSRSGDSYISPFYVVHYGIMYSEAARTARFTGQHWRLDPSLEYWNIPPPALRLEWFRATADWIVERLDYSTGQAHLMYDFDWGYRGYPNGGLQAPWWSGLTDGYAIILLLRAYDVFGDDAYRAAAAALYESVLTDVSQGGSLTHLDGYPWIEEYVDPRANTDEMSYVLNGMVYAASGVDAFESSASAISGDTSAAALYRSIANNIHRFDLGYWSSYDLIGTVANIKYHRIHVALLRDLSGHEGLAALSGYADRWSFGAAHAGFFWVVYGVNSPAKYHFLLLLLVILIFPVVLYKVVQRIAYVRLDRRSRDAP